MPELFKDNPYPLLMFHPTLEPSNALDEKMATDMRRKGYQDQYIPKAYPVHIYTGEVRDEVSQWDGGITKVPVTVIAHDKAEHDALLEKYGNVEPGTVKRGPGRPPKVS